MYWNFTKGHTTRSVMMAVLTLSAGLQGCRQEAQDSDAINSAIVADGDATDNMNDASGDAMETAPDPDPIAAPAPAPTGVAPPDVAEDMGEVDAAPEPAPAPAPEPAPEPEVVEPDPAAEDPPKTDPPADETAEDSPEETSEERDDNKTDIQKDASYPQMREEIFAIDFDNLPDNWVGEPIDEELAHRIFIDPFDLHEYSFVRNGTRNRGFGGKCPNGKDVVFLDEKPGQGKMMCIRHCAEEKIEENLLHMHWTDDGKPTEDRIVAEYDFLVPECMGTNRNCTAEWGGKMLGLGHGHGGAGKGDSCGRNKLSWKKGYPGGSEAAFHGMSYRTVWRNPGLIDTKFPGADYVGRNEACEVKKGVDDGDLLNMEMYIYYWKGKYQKWGGRQGSEVSMCNLPKAGKWTKMTMSVDPVENTFESWVNGQRAGKHTAPQSQSCGGTKKDPVEGVSGLYMGNFFGGAAPKGKWATPEQVMCFDNIKVYKTF